MRALPKNRLKALGKFVRSEYHVTHPGVPVLFDWLKNNLDKPDLDIKNSGRILPEADGNPRRIYHLTNYLMEAVETFLAWEIWSADEHTRNAATVETLRRLNLPERAAAMLRYARKRHLLDPMCGEAHLHANCRLHWETYQLSLQQGRAKHYNAQELSDAQDLAFICEKLRMGCILVSHQQVARQFFDEGLLTPVLQYLQLQGARYLDVPIVAAYYHGYFAQKGGAEADEHFAKLKVLLQEHSGSFSIAENHDLFLLAINFCIKRINQQEQRYFNEIFDLYQAGLQQGALLENGVLSRWTYNNITTTALRLCEFAWAKQFIDEYANYLPEAHRSGAVHFNLAKYHYATGEYREAMRHLLYIEYDDVLQNLVAKTMLCKIYYTLGETDALENQLDSIQIYLRRKKVIGYHRENYSAIVRFFRKLVAINPNRTEEKRQLQEEILAAPVLTERDWMLKQLE